MRLISKKNLFEAIKPYPDSQKPIESWYTLIKNSNWESLEEVKQVYSRSVDEVYGFTIFNIKGNKYRLIVRINYSRKIVFFQNFLTHKEYSKINWNNKNEVQTRMKYKPK